MKKMDGYERRKQKKMEQIYTAAFQLIMKYGFSKVTVNEIAEKARVSPATIFNYFGTKEQLYLEMLNYWMEKQLVVYEEILCSERSFPEKIKEIMLCEAKNLKALSDGVNQTLGSETEALNIMQSISEEKLNPFFEKLVELGKQEGYIRSIYTKEASQQYLKMYMNEFNRNLQSKSEEDIDLKIDQLLEFFFYGLIGNK